MKNEMLLTLLCSDIDNMCKAAKSYPKHSCDFLNKLQEMKDKLLNDEKFLELRYKSTCWLEDNKITKDFKQ